MFLNKPATFCLLFCLFAGLASGQELPPVFHFSNMDYAAQNQNWAIGEDAESGSIFFANNGGLLEFDGTRWQKFSLPDGQIVRSVACQNGRVFVGGFAEFGFFERQTGLFFEKMTAARWKYHSLSQSLGDDAAARREEIWQILPTENAVFFQSFGTIYRFDGAKTVRLEPPSSLMFLQKTDGPGLLFQGIGGGLFELSDDGNFKFLDGSEALSTTSVAFILPQKTMPGEPDGLLVGTKNDGIFTFKNGELRPWPNPLNPRLKAAQLNKATRLADGGLAFGTILDGVFLLDSLENLRFHLNQEAGLQNNTILSMLADRAGNLWLGLDKGIDLLQPGSSLRRFTDRSGKIGTVYSAAIFENRLFLGTNQGVFSIFDFRFRVSDFAQSKIGNPKSKIEILRGSQGQVWQLQVIDNQLVIGHNDGTFVFKNGQLSKISAITGGWTTLRFPSKSDRLVQGTYTGLVLFETDEKGFWKFSRRIDGFAQPVKKMAFDSLGNLVLWHPNRGKWAVRLTDDGSRVAQIRQLSDEMQPPEPFIFLPNGPSGGRFLLQNGGLVFEKTGQTSVSFPVSLVPGSENVVALEPGRWLFCLEDGYAIWDEKLAAGPTLFERARVSSVEILSGGGGWFFPDFLKKTSENEPEWRFSASQNDLRFHFSAPVFGQKMHWKWRLLESSNFGAFNRSPPKWVAAEAGFVELTDLAPGRFELQILADGLETGAFSFKIRRPWWQTGWAIFGWICLATALLFLIEKWNRRRIGRQLALLEKEKDRELAAQKAESERDFLKNEVENRARELSNSTLSLIRKNEALLELQTELEKSALPDRDRERLNRLIERHLSSDHDWQIFESAFNEVHDEFFRKLKSGWPELTPGDLRLAAFLKLNLSSKEIASLFGLSVRGVENKRYRLRKKLGLGESENLSEVMMRF